jgi:multisubunit Na+/H+ antiporter MnhE subunit
MNKPTAAATLLWRFLCALLVSGLQTLRVIVRAGRLHGQAPRSGFVRVPVAPLTPQGTALLACLVSLTPGTSVVEIDAATQSIVLHMLDVSAAQATVDSIRRDFEPGLRVWFARPAP